MNPDSRASVLLRQTRVLAFELKQSDLDQWARRELDGYDGVNADHMPKYRVIGIGARGHFVGGFGRQISNAPIHTNGFPQEVRKMMDRALTEFYARAPISEYEEMLVGDGEFFQADLSGLVQYLNGTVYENMNCIGLMGTFGRGSVRGILEGVKNRILDLTIELSTHFPTGVSDYIMKNPTPVSNVINTVIHGGQPNIAVASENFSQSITINNHQGNGEGLKSLLLEHGAPEPIATELVSAVETEALVGGDFGPKVSKVVGKLMSLAADGTWKISIAIAGKLLADSIERYYGIR